MPRDEKTQSAHEIVLAIFKCNGARDADEYDEGLKEFMAALDYYVGRQNQSWIK